MALLGGLGISLPQMDVVDGVEILCMSKREVLGRCGLCDNKAVLEESHVVPKFIARRGKSKEISPYFRSFGNPNKRTQDFPKAHFLCGECKDRFSLAEKHFAETVDVKYSDKTFVPFTCTELQYYFAVSIVWRCLSMVGDYPLTQTGWDFIKEISYGMKPYLLGKTGIPETNAPFIHFFRLPLFIDGENKDGTPSHAPEDINRKLHGAIGPILLSKDDNVYLVVFMLGYFLVALLSLDGPNFIAWTFNTQMKPGAEIIPLGCKGTVFGNIADNKFWRCIQEWVEGLNMEVSPKQHAVMKKDFQATAKDAQRRSPAIRAAYIDHVNHIKRKKN